MKKIVLLLLVPLSLTSCFYTHRAREIEVYEIDKPKGNDNGVSTFIFEFTGNRKNFRPYSKRFFNIKKDYLPFSFKTDALYGDESLNVYLYLGNDTDKIINLFSIVWNSIFYNSDDDDTPQQKIDNAEDGMKMSVKERHSYLHIQVTDEDGNDILTEKSMRNKAVMEKLVQYQRLIN